MTIHQISVFLENRAGQLAEITALLAKNGVDLRAINIAETSDYGVLRLIASHEPEACRVLRENGFIFSTSDVVARRCAGCTRRAEHAAAAAGRKQHRRPLHVFDLRPAERHGLYDPPGRRSGSGLLAAGCQRHPSRRCGNARHHLRRVTRKGRQTPCRK